MKTIQFDKFDMRLIDEAVKAVLDVAETISLDKEDTVQGHNQAIDFVILQLKNAYEEKR